MVVLAVACLVGACSTPRSAAPVVDRTQPPSKSSDAARQRTQAATQQQTSQSPVAPTAAPTAQRGFYVVKRGDTLGRIAQEFSQNWRDLVSWNNLASANDIKVDQVLRVAPPEAGSPLNGAQTGSIANSGVEVRPLTPQASAAPLSKSGPRGDKRTFSDATLADMQKSDAASPVTQSKVEPVRPVEKADSPSAGADEVTDWIWPTEGKLIGGFDGNKKGIDIAGTMGQPIIAVAPGTVLYASSVRGYGNLVIVKHTNNILSAYAHNKTILVKEGQTVSKGQRIAEMGNSDADTVKLHFEIRQQGKPVDPTKFLPNR